MISPLDPPSGFGGDWVTPNHSEYDSAILRWARNSRRRAYVVAFVRDALDVASVISYARAHKLPIAIRGGGHSSAGASSVENGVVIDLSRHMNGARIDAEKRLAYVGGGALWKDVDEAGMKYGLATVGGTINHVTIVTADGSIFTASEQENPELFWGVRGGGCNFGVVTEFVYKMHPQRATVFCGNVLFPGNTLPAIMDKLKTWWEGGPSPKCSILLFITVSPDGNPINILSFFYNGSEGEGRAYFKPFFDIGPIADMAKEMPYEAVNGIQNERLVHDVNYYVKGVFTSRLRKPDALAVQQRSLELARNTGILPAFILELFPSEKALSIDRDSTSFLRWEGISNLAVVTWTGDDSGEKQEEAKQLVHELCSIVSTSDDKLSASENTGYGNYMTEDQVKDVNGNVKMEFRSAALFGHHYSRLQALKKKYDPEVVFNKWNTIVPA
ncbi:FAD-binding domain-containing protein [Vararia minispora EC-137]|uniref:FAD-binding domain-containing protein n=1 Tax=Vararia minispora EC-137 TaxID=1314806 RepID=A0ACB8QFX7_9AGAM|nr:FAD-binding domain-containing protein [Vararia minispora EC-137]